MSMKKLLGLGSCNLTDMEIMKQIKIARSKNQTEVVFHSNSKEVCIHLTQINPDGITSGYYWAES